MTKRDLPALVYIDVTELYYARYVGKTRTVGYKAAELLEPKWVETLRVRPEDLLAEPDAA